MTEFNGFRANAQSNQCPATGSQAEPRRVVMKVHVEQGDSIEYTLTLPPLTPFFGAPGNIPHNVVKYSPYSGEYFT